MHGFELKLEGGCQLHQTVEREEYELEQEREQLDSLSR